MLTPDFAAKMLVIHERLKSGHSVILSGDTVHLLLLVIFPENLLYIRVWARQSCSTCILSSSMQTPAMFPTS